MDKHVCAILSGRPWVFPWSLSDLPAPAPGSLRISLAPDGEGKVEEGSGEGLYKVLRMKKKGQHCMDARYLLCSYIVSAAAAAFSRIWGWILILGFNV